LTNSSELFLERANRARLLAVGATNAGARQEFLRLAEKFEAAALADEAGEVPDEVAARWPFR
jgi:hypothetical protein